MLCNSGICVVSVVYLVVFFFKQKTAYEMRISDWSSDVCSSDLQRDRAEIGIERDIGPRVGSGGGRRIGRCGCGLGGEGEEREKHREHGQRSEERRVGKSVSVRVDLGGRRIIKKKTLTQNTRYSQNTQIIYLGIPVS